jgi:hypothetical protein
MAWTLPLIMLGPRGLDDCYLRGASFAPCAQSFFSIRELLLQREIDL